MAATANACADRRTAKIFAAALDEGPPNRAPRREPAKPVQQRGPPNRVVVETFQGTGVEATRPFTVGDGWEVQWEAGRFFSIELYGANGGYQDLLANQTRAGGGASYVARGGTYTLDITGTGGGGWTVRVVDIPG